MAHPEQPKADQLQLHGGALRIHKAATFFLGVAATINALRSTFNVGYNYGTFVHSYTPHGNCCVGFLESFIIPITLGLIVSAFFISRRTPMGTVVSLLALLVVIFFHLLWYRGTRSILQAAEVESFWRLPDEKQYVLPLSYATWWDILVLGVVIILLIWHIRTLGPFVWQLFRNRSAGKSGPGAHSDLSRDSRQKLDHVAS